MHLRYVIAATVCFGFALGCSDDNAGFPDARRIDAPPPNGTVSLTWTLTDMQGTQITCDRVNGQTVTIELHNEDETGGFTEVFSCSSGSGTTPADMPPGTYDITIYLKAPGNLVLAMTQQQLGVVVKAGQDTPLPDATFAVDATGGLALHVTANQSGGNCAPTTSMGAGITGMTITLLRSSDGTCAPELLTVGAGATSGTAAFQYQIDCTTPPVAPCIENDQPITVTSMDSGGYQIHIRGREDANECWQNDDSIVVPAAGTTLDSTLNLGPTGNSGC